MVSHRWRPLQGLESQSSEVDFHEIDSLHWQWLIFRKQREVSSPNAYKSFLERVERRWAIETGIIEGLYNIDRGVTQTLVENGLIAELIDRGATDRSPQEIVKVLKDHQRRRGIRNRVYQAKDRSYPRNISGNYTKS